MCHSTHSSFHQQLQKSSQSCFIFPGHKLTVFSRRLLDSSHTRDPLSQRSRIMSQESLNPASCLLSLHPFIDQHGLLCVGGRQTLNVYLWIEALPHFTWKTSSLPSHHQDRASSSPSCWTYPTGFFTQRYHIVGGRKVVCSITRACVTCRQNSVKPQP